jgi:predicted ester cyclase
MFPDVQATHEDIIAQGDKVVIRWTLSGTQSGPWMGIPPTGRSFRISGIDIFCVVEGKLAEMWQEGDTIGFLQQLGVIPAAEQNVL